MLTDEQSYKDYFQALATSHVDITGFKFGDEEELNVAAKTGFPPPSGGIEGGLTLWADRHRPVELRDDRSDNYLGERTATLMVMGVDPEVYEDQHALYLECESIVTDFISKLLKDYNEGLISTLFSRYKWGEGEIELSSTAYRGCRLDITWQSPVDLTYNEAKWA